MRATRISMIFLLLFFAGGGVLSSAPAPDPALYYLENRDPYQQFDRRGIERIDVILISSTRLRKTPGFEEALAEYIEVLERTEGWRAEYLEIDSDTCREKYGCRADNPRAWGEIRDCLEIILDESRASYLILLGGPRVIPRPAQPMFIEHGELMMERVPADSLYLDFDRDQVPDPGCSLGRMPGVGTGSESVAAALRTAADLHRRGGFTLDREARFGGLESYDEDPYFPTPPYGDDLECPAWGREAFCDLLSSRDFIRFGGHGTPTSLHNYRHLLLIGINIGLILDRINLQTHHPVMIAAFSCRAGVLFPERETLATGLLRAGAGLYLARTTARDSSTFVYNNFISDILAGERAGDSLYNRMREAGRGEDRWRKGSFNQLQLYGDPSLRRKFDGFTAWDNGDFDFDSLPEKYPGLPLDGQTGYPYPPEPNNLTPYGDGFKTDGIYRYPDADNITKNAEKAGADLLLISSSRLEDTSSFRTLVNLYRNVLMDTEGLRAEYIEIDGWECESSYGIRADDPGNWKVVRQVLRELVEQTGARYLMLLGGLEVIARPELEMGWPDDTFPVRSDAFYLDFDFDDIVDPGLSIGRIPDLRRRSDIVSVGLQTAIELHRKGGYTLDNLSRLGTEEYPAPPYGDCPDCDRDRLREVMESSDYIYFSGHGGPNYFKTDDWTSIIDIYDDNLDWLDLNDLHPVIMAYTPCNAGRLLLWETYTFIRNFSTEFTRRGAGAFIARTTSEGVPTYFAEHFPPDIEGGARIGNALFTRMRESCLPEFTGTTVSSRMKGVAANICLYGDPTLRRRPRPIRVESIYPDPPEIYRP